jgi:nucleoid-associated protein YgaU
MPRRVNKKTGPEQENYLDKITDEVESNQSRLSLILGGLIVLVVVILIFNYFNKNNSSLGPSQQTELTNDVSVENLPGQYTVKEGDTLFTIAEKYYSDGYKFPEIAKENNISDENKLEVGQILQVPKLEEESSKPSITEVEKPVPSPSPNFQINDVNLDEKGALDETMISEQWGPPITADTYTVTEGDWLSKIAGRAYGDIFAYQRIADANHISNPDLIIPGQVLTIPR